MIPTPTVSSGMEAATLLGERGPMPKLQLQEGLGFRVEGLGFRV